MSHLRIFQNNINGFYSKAQILEINLFEEQPHFCLLQEWFRSRPKDTEHHFQFLYKNFWSETGRTEQEYFVEGICIQLNEYSIQIRTNSISSDTNLAGSKLHVLEKQNQSYFVVFT